MSRFVAHSGTRIVHEAGCRWGMMISDRNTTCFDRLYDAIGQGYRECQYCLTESGRIWERSAAMRASWRRKNPRCLVCRESVVVMQAHIIPARFGGHELMPLCANHHWKYDHGLMTKEEFEAVENWIFEKHGHELLEAVRRNYLYWVRVQKTK